MCPGVWRQAYESQEKSTSSSMATHSHEAGQRPADLASYMLWGGSILFPVLGGQLIHGHSISSWVIGLTVKARYSKSFEFATGSQLVGCPMVLRLLKLFQMWTFA